MVERITSNDEVVSSILAVGIQVPISLFLFFFHFIFAALIDTWWSRSFIHLDFLFFFFFCFLLCLVLSCLVRILLSQMVDGWMASQL